MAGGFELFPRDKIVGIFRGFQQGGLEFHDASHHGFVGRLQLDEDELAVHRNICKIIAIRHDEIGASANMEPKIICASDGTNVSALLFLLITPSVGGIAIIDVLAKRSKVAFPTTRVVRVCAMFRTLKTSWSYLRRAKIRARFISPLSQEV